MTSGSTRRCALARLGRRPSAGSTAAMVVLVPCSRRDLPALISAPRGSERPLHYGLAAENDSKGCGGVMRSAPFGLIPPHRFHHLSTSRLFDWAAEAAGYTH